MSSDTDPVQLDNNNNVKHIQHNINPATTNIKREPSNFMDELNFPTLFNTTDSPHSNTRHIEHSQSQFSLPNQSPSDNNNNNINNKQHHSNDSGNNSLVPQLEPMSATPRTSNESTPSSSITPHSLTNSPNLFVPWRLSPLTYNKNITQPSLYTMPQPSYNTNNSPLLLDRFGSYQSTISGAANFTPLINNTTLNNNGNNNDNNNNDSNGSLSRWLPNTGNGNTAIPNVRRDLSYQSLGINSPRQLNRGLISNITNSPELQQLQQQKFQLSQQNQANRQFNMMNSPQISPLNYSNGNNNVVNNKLPNGGNQSKLANTVMAQQAQISPADLQAWRDKHSDNKSPKDQQIDDSNIQQQNIKQEPINDITAPQHQSISTAPPQQQPAINRVFAATPPPQSNSQLLNNKLPGGRYTPQPNTQTQTQPQPQQQPQMPPYNNNIQPSIQQPQSQPQQHTSPQRTISPNTNNPSSSRNAAHRDRSVKAAMRINIDHKDSNVQLEVIDKFYIKPSQTDEETGLSVPSQTYKVRLIKVINTITNKIDCYVHAADIGGVVERKSNISRLFGQFESPSEKLLMNVQGAHNHSIGQESNILTYQGVKTFFTQKKMKNNTHYRTWIENEILPAIKQIATSTLPGNAVSIAPAKERNDSDSEQTDYRRKKRKTNKYDQHNINNINNIQAQPTMSYPQPYNMFNPSLQHPGIYQQAGIHSAYTSPSPSIMPRQIAQQSYHSGDPTIQAYTSIQPPQQLSYNAQHSYNMPTQPQYIPASYHQPQQSIQPHYGTEDDFNRSMPLMHQQSIGNQSMPFASPPFNANGIPINQQQFINSPLIRYQ